MMKKIIFISSVVMTLILISGCTPVRPDPRYLTLAWRIWGGGGVKTTGEGDIFMGNLIYCGGNMSHGWKIFEIRSFPLEPPPGKTPLYPPRTPYPPGEWPHPRNQTAPEWPTLLMRVDEGVRWWLIKADERYYLTDYNEGGKIKRTYTKEELPEIENIGITGRIMVGKREAQYIDADAVTSLIPLDGLICSNNESGFLVQPDTIFWSRVLMSHAVFNDKILIGESEDINDLVRLVQERNSNSLKTENKPDESAKEDINHPTKGLDK